MGEKAIIFLTGNLEQLERKEKEMKRKKLIALFMSMALASSGAVGSVSASAADTLVFNEPAVNASIKIRTWWPSADITDEEIAAEVKTIADAGFGGIELIGITEGYEKDAVDAGVYGWSTERWNKAVEALYQEANKYGLTVDLTIGPRWPAGVPGLDLDSDAACREAKANTLHVEISEAGKGEYTLPTVTSNYTENPQFVALIAAKTSGTLEEKEEVEVPENAGPWWSAPAYEYTLESNTLQVIDSSSIDFENGTFTFDAPDTGEWTFFALYAVPTGGTSGDTSPTAYVIDHFSKAGTEAILNYWEDNMITDSLLNQWKTYGGDLFEDSLEVSFSNLPWSSQLLNYFESNKGYDITKYLPLLLSWLSTDDLMEKYTASDNDTINEEVFNDFCRNLSDMYIENHVKVVEEWCKSKNVKYRAQAQGTSDNGWVNPLEAQTYTDVVEGETLGMNSSLDAWRSLAGAANMSGTEIVSVELGAEFGSLYQVSWQRLNEVLNRAAMGGANQFILHGYATDSQKTSLNKWPGWMPFDEPRFSEAWGPRMAQWDNMSEFTNYISRLMAVLQYGTAAVDFAVYRDDLGIRTDEGYTDGVLFLTEDALPGENVTMKNGYVYNYIAPGNFSLDAAVVEDGVLNREYAGYKALVLNNLTKMELADAEQILAYAEAGLPVVLIGETPTADGTYGAQDDDAVAAVFEKLKEMDTVAVAAKEEELVNALTSLGITSSVQYTEEASLAVQHRTSEKADLYYMYNYTSSYDYADNAVAISDGNDITMDITLKGKGSPYRLDPWTGEITAMTNYTDNGDGTITLNITAKDSDPLIIGITADSSVFGTVTEAVDLASMEASKISLDESPWTLDVVSYQPGEAALDSSSEDYNPNDVAKVSLDTISLDSLKAWPEIKGLENISGQGVYTTAVTMEAPVDEAVLSIGNTYDSILYVEVNGNVIDTINQITREVKIGSYLKEGENTISIKTATTLAAAVRAAGGNCSENDSYITYPSSYGLLGGVTLTSYTKA